ncbi:MAG TPA: alpha-E domain-containing protein [Pseudomonadaceae bacterium]|nr:alpha-E domain-containing protein [Pseudomonadaceae bacterium]
MLSSVAERIYWLGRYLERVENTARLVNVYSAMLLDLPRGSHIGWGILVDITGCYEAYEKQYESVEEKQVVRFLLADSRNPASVINCAAMMRENARTSREIIPAEAWEQINDLYLALKEGISRTISRRSRQQILDDVVNDCLRISGMLDGSMSHNTAYAFIQVGRKLERADMTSRIVDTGSISLLPIFADTSKQRLLLEPYENIVWMNVLRCLGGYQAYRQEVRNLVTGEEVVRYLLQDEEFPRAVSFCLSSLGGQLDKLPNNDEVQMAVARVRKVIARVDIGNLLQSGLLDFIDELQISIADIHDALSDTWFRPAELRQNQL